jgi:F420-non-reducing hydrogenase iron-sulfur subunit
MTIENNFKVIGIACERSVDFAGKLDENGYMIENPDVKIIKVPCSGHIQPIMLESALKNGAAGTFAIGCRMGDCHYRDGNRFCRDRMIGQRMPKLKPSVDKRRVEGYWLSAIEYDKFRDMVASFSESCKALPAPEVKAVKAPAQKA